jgi:predicted nucleic acid-binding protein
MGIELLSSIQTSQVVAYKQVRKIKTPDAIILATARQLGAELVTVNEDDFKNLDPTVSIFVPRLI